MNTKSNDSYTRAIRELLASDEYQDIGDRQEQAEEALREMRRSVAADPRRARHVKLAVAERHVSLLAAKRRTISNEVMRRHACDV